MVDRPRPLMPRRNAARLLAGALLALSVLASTIWQWQGRAHQHVDVGGALDSVAVDAAHFHAPEHSASGPAATYRWSFASAMLELAPLPPGTLASIRLRMFAPAQPDGPQRATILANGQRLADVAVQPTPRDYRFLIEAPASGAPLIGLESPRLAVSGDPRELGVAVDSIQLDVPGGPTLADLLREIWSPPLLAGGLLLIALAALLLRLPALAVGGAPALALLALALADRFVPDARLLLASYVFAAAATLAGAIGLAEIVRQFPRLLPNDDRRAIRWIAAAFVLALAVTYIPTIRSDGIEYYAYLRSLAVDGDLNFRNEYQQTPFPLLSDAFGPTVTGHYDNLASVGPAIAWSPLYAVAHLIVLAGRALGMPWNADGYDLPYVVLTTFGSALATLIGMLAGYRICRRWVGPPAAALAVIAALFGSNLLYYGMREGSFAHAVSGAAATLYLLAWLRLEERPSIGRWAALGAAAGAMVIAYWISALVLVLPALTFARLALAALREPSERRAAALRELMLGGLLAAILLVLVFSPQMIAWKIIYGSFLANPHGGDYIRVREFQGLKLLFSHLFGLLPWTPAFFAGLVGLALLWRRARWQTICLFAAFLLYFGYNASLGRWFAGGSFGLRRMTVVAPWFVLGLALLLDALRRWRAAAPVALAVLMAMWSWLLLMRYDLFLIPHIPEEIDAMPALSFFLNRDTLPFWAARGWLRAGFFLGQLRDAGSPGALVVLLVLAAVMALAIWAVLAAYRRLTVSKPDAETTHWNAEPRVSAR